MHFDTLFTYIMDRIVCVILLSVAVSLVLNLSNAAPQTANGPLFPATAQAQTQAPGTVVTDAAGRTFNLAPLAPLPPLSPLAPLTAAQQQGAPGRLSFIDSIFKIPIDTLNAVNDLIAGFTRGFGSAPYRRPTRSIMSGGSSKR